MSTSGSRVTGSPGTSDTSAEAGSIRSEVTATAARQGALGLIGAITAGAGGLVLTIAVGRLLSAQDAGIYFTAVALFTIASSILMLGTDTGLVRALSGLRASGRPDLLRTALSHALRPVSVVSVMVALTVGLTADPLSQWVFHGPTAHQMGVVLTLLAPFLVLSTLSMVLLNGAARGLGSLRTFTTVQQVFLPVSRPVLLALTVLLVTALGASGDAALGASTATWAVAAWASPLVIAVLLAWREVHRLLPSRAAGTPSPGTEPHPASSASSTPSAPPGDHTAGAFWRATAPRAVAASFEVLIVWADVVLVTALLGAAPAAVYAAASRFVTSGTFALQAVRLSVGPLLAGAFARGDRTEAEHVHRLSVRWAVLSTWPVYLTLAIFSPGVLSILGPGFVTAATVLTLLSTAMLLVVATGNANTVLNMARRSHWAAANTGTAVVVMLTLDLLLVPRMGILGAAVGWSAAMVTDAVAGTLEVRRGLGLHSLDAGAGRAMATALVAFGLPALTIRSGVAVLDPDAAPVVVLLIGGLIATGCYLAALAVQRVPLELDELIGALRRRRPSPAGEPAAESGAEPGGRPGRTVPAQRPTGDPTDSQAPRVPRVPREGRSA